MSRLDSMLRRLTAQRDGLNWAAQQISGVAGDVLDLGLGNGRTYDHLREVMPERSRTVVQIHQKKKHKTVCNLSKINFGH